MTLADELRATGIRRPIRGGLTRRHLCADETGEHLRELKLQGKRAYQREWRLNNPGRVKAMRERDHAKRSEAIRKYQVEWRQKNIAHVRAYQARKMREWRREYPDRVRESRARWAKKNRPAINARRRALAAEKRLALKGVVA